MCDDAFALAVKLRDGAAQKTARAYRTKLESDKAEREKVAESLKVLETKATDPEANLRVGLWKIRRKQNWTEGINHLALGSDKPLSDVAALDLAQPKVAAEQLALADKWWALTESKELSDREVLQERSRFWYRAALPSLTGLVRQKAQLRLLQTIVWNADDVRGADAFVPLKDYKVPLAIRNRALQFPQSAATFAPSFRKIKSAKIQLAVSGEDWTGASVCVGPVTMILNWEQKNENHFRYCFDAGANRSTPTSPHCLVKGRLHQIVVQEEAGKVKVIIDDKEHYACDGELAGTITVKARGPKCVLSLKEIAVEGEVDTTTKVTGPIPSNVY